MTDIDDAYLAERERIRAGATPGQWAWHWRKGDEDAPGSIFSEPYFGHAYAVAMCPRYGKDKFSADADLIVDAVNHQPVLIDEIRRLREENDTINEEIDRLRGLLAEVAGSGVELQDDRMRYLVVQIRRDLWARVAEASKP